MSNVVCGSTIKLASGSYFDYTDPWNSHFTIDDIAISLGKACRFTGHCRGFYSVAEHSVYVSLLVPPEDALAGLLHDATEAFMTDIPRPLKNLLPQYKELENKVEQAVLARFGLGHPLPASVKHADTVMLLTEQQQIMPDPSEKWSGMDGIVPADIRIQQLDYQAAMNFFMARFIELTA